MVPEKMKVEDTEQALTEAVCSRVREQLGSADADLAESFARQLYRWVAAEDVAERDPLDLYGLALGHFNFARERAPGTPKVRVYNPRFEEHGWQSTHTAVEIVTDDMPFLIDSVSMELNRRGFGVHLIIHPVLGVRRDDDGELLEILPQPPGEKPEEGVLAESVIHAEVARQTDPEKLHELELHLERVIAEVRATVEDWAAMRSQALDVAAEIRDAPSPASSEDVDETVAFLEWLEAHNFTFLGYREYDADGPKGPGLGILRGPLEGEDAGPSPAPRLLTLTKANSRATVHRPSYLDYVGVKRFDADGNVTGERRFLGLYTHTAYRATPTEIPILRRRVAADSRARGLPARQPQREGAARDPRHLPARRAVPDLHGRAVRRGDGDPPPRRAPAAAAVRTPGPVRPLLLAARVRAARPLQHREPAPHRGDPAKRHQRREHRLHHARVRVRAGAAPLRGVRGARPDAGLRRPRGRDDARGGHALMGRRPPGGARRGSGRGGRRRAVPPLCGCLSRRIPRRLGGALRARRHRAHRGAAEARGARHQPLPPARGRAAHAAREAVPGGARAHALRRAAAVREHGRGGRRRAPLPDRPAGRRRGLDLRLRPDLPGRRRPRCRRRPRQLPGRLRARLARRGGERRLQPPRPRRRAHLARDHRAAGDRQVPAPGPPHVQRPLRGAGARGPSGDRAADGGAVPGPLRPSPHRPQGRRRGGGAHRDGDRRGREPRPGPDPAHVPGRDPGHAAHQLLPHRAERARVRTCRSSSTRRSCAGCRSPAPASRSSSTRLAPRACTCAVGPSRAAASAGRTAARTSAPRCSG